MLAFSLEHVSLLGKDESGAPLWILQDITLDIEQGRVCTIMGPSGAGKSTLLSLLNRLQDPTDGRILYDGVDLVNHDVLELRRRVGLVFQHPSLFEGSVFDNVVYPIHLSGQMDRAATGDLVRRLLDDVGLAPEFIHRSVDELSGGEQQRVALARTLALDPEVLLLDEVTAALDPEATGRIEQLLIDHCRDGGKTLVWVTHDRRQAQRVADWTVLISQGRVRQVVSPNELWEEGPGRE